MAYEVLARKWRPQQFDDVVGQEHVTATLKNAIKSDRIAHAYIFIGPRGIGKTSVARIFAKALNCAKGPTVTPCEVCDSCKEITAGNSLDVLEIDGASNNGVEQVRDLRETVKYAPTHGHYKIYIIDEVHMLSAAAFNALLKTLEEPPPHVKFIFATTEPQKILATILSRCQRFDLRRISVPLIVERLREIAKSEEVEASEDALLAIARGAEGGLRDAESALDQLISFRGRKITEEDVLSVFGLVARSTLEQLGENVLKGNAQELISLVARLDEAGKDLQRLVLDLMAHFRNLLVLLNVADPKGAVELTEGQIEALRQQARLTNTERLLRIVDILAATEDRMRYALSRRIVLETALIRCSRAAVVVSLEDILTQIRQLGAGESAAPGAAAATGTAAPSGAAQAPLRPPAPPAAAVRGPAESREALASEWANVLERVAKLNMATRNALRDTRPVAVEDGSVVVGVDAEFSEMLEELESPRHRKVLEQALTAVMKRAVTVKFTLLAARPVASEASNGAEPAPPAQSVGAAAVGSEAKARTKTRAEWLNEPAVRKTMEVFKGTVTDVRE